MKLEHFYESIPGWFDFQDIYRQAVEEAQDGDVLVEVGTWVGRSLAFLATEIVNSGKHVELISVDPLLIVQREPTMTGKQDPAYEESMRRWEGMHLDRVLQSNLGPAMVHGSCWWHCTSSVKAISLLTNFRENLERTLSFVFIDGDHEYESVLADLRAWWPQVKPGGMLAGHDYTAEFPGVVQAVNDFFTQTDGELAVFIEKRGNSFVVRKEA